MVIGNLCSNFVTMDFVQ